MKILDKTLASWSSHHVRTLSLSLTKSGLVAFLGLTALSVHLLSCSFTVKLKLLQFGGQALASLGPLSSKHAKKTIAMLLMAR